jgi:hypothetical protein
MSDSLNATVIVSVLVLTISANGVFDPLPDEDPPRLPAEVLAPADALEEDDDDDEEFEALELEPADTASPAVRPASEAIVPPVGAYSFVLSSAL